MKSKTLLILALVMAAITTILFFNYMNQLNTEQPISEELVGVVVAKERIPENTMLNASLLEIKEVPEKGLHPQVIKDISQLEGLFVTSPIEAGEPLLEHRVQSKLEEQVFLSRKVKDGYRAVSIGVDFVESVSNLIEPEDFVDVVLSVSESTESAEANTINTSIILQKVRVLAVGRKFVENTVTPEEHVEYSSVTLELLPEDTIKLINGTQRGPIHLSIHTRILTPDNKEEDRN